MTTDDTLREAAFEALEQLISWSESFPDDEDTADAVANLRAALGCDDTKTEHEFDMEHALEKAHWGR